MLFTAELARMTPQALQEVAGAARDRGRRHPHQARPPLPDPRRPHPARRAGGGPGGRSTGWSRGSASSVLPSTPTSPVPTMCMSRPPRSVGSGFETATCCSVTSAGPRRGERYFGLKDLEKVNGDPAVENPERPEFEKLTPLHPDRMIRLENDPADLASRVVDLVAPIGAGQRGPHRGAAAGGKDRAPAVHRQRHSEEPPGHRAAGAPRGRTPGRGFRHGPACPGGKS